MVHSSDAHTPTDFPFNESFCAHDTLTYVKFCRRTPKTVRIKTNQSKEASTECQKMKNDIDPILNVVSCSAGNFEFTSSLNGRRQNKHKKK